MRLLRLAVLALPLWLGSCALLAPEMRRRVSGPAPAAILTAEARATADVRGVTVALTLHNPGPGPAELRSTAQVNWGTCGMPPYVALSRVDAQPVQPPASAGPLTCLDLGLIHRLAPGESLTLRRTLPLLAPGSYRLTAWFDGEVDGQPARVGAPPVVLEVP